MSIKKTASGNYAVENSSFFGTEFGASQDICKPLQEYMMSPPAGFVLQSAREAALLRIEANSGGLGFHACQATRTYAIYFGVGEKEYVAFDDATEPSENLIAKTFRIKEGKESSILPNEGMFFLREPEVNKAINRAKNAGRCVELPRKSPLEIYVEEFGFHPLGKAIFGDIAEKYALYLDRSSDYIVDCLTFRPYNKYDRLKFVVVRPVTLGEISYRVRNRVDAGSYFGFWGNACFVRNPPKFQ